MLVTLTEVDRLGVTLVLVDEVSENVQLGVVVILVVKVSLGDIDAFDCVWVLLFDAMGKMRHSTDSATILIVSVVQVHEHVVVPDTEMVSGAKQSDVTLQVSQAACRVMEA